MIAQVECLLCVCSSHLVLESILYFTSSYQNVIACRRYLMKFYVAYMKINVRIKMNFSKEKF